MQRNDTSYTDAVAITKSDTTLLSIAAFYVGVTGDVAVQVTAGVTAVVFKAVPAGTIVRLPVARIMSTSTTATDIVGLIA